MILIFFEIQKTIGHDLTAFSESISQQQNAMKEFIEKKIRKVINRILEAAR